MTLADLSLATPDYLLVALAAPTFLTLRFLRRHRRHKYAVRFTNMDVLLSVARSRPRGGVGHIVSALVLLSLLTAAVALAGPRLVLARSRHQGATVMLLVDVSGSMAAADVYPTRLGAAIDLLDGFVKGLPGDDRVGLITVSDETDVLSAPTDDHAAIVKDLAGLRPEAGTALGDGVETAVRVVVASLNENGVSETKDAHIPAAVVLVSDGGQDRGSTSPTSAAEFAAMVGVPIYGIVIGTYRGFIYQRVQGGGAVRVKIPVPPDYGSIALFSRQTGGEVFHILAAKNLDAITRRLISGVGRDKQVTVIASWFDLAAALLVLSAIGISRRWGAALP